MPDFVPGLVLAFRFYREAVRAILDDAAPGLPHSAALIGSGSEVLGFDTPVSTDHHWGPRAMIFLRDEDHATHADEIRHALATRLPHDFLGWPTSFAQPDPADHGTRHPWSEGPAGRWTLRSGSTPLCRVARFGVREARRRAAAGAAAHDRAASRDLGRFVSVKRLSIAQADGVVLARQCRAMICRRTPAKSYATNAPLSTGILEASSTRSEACTHRGCDVG